MNFDPFDNVISSPESGYGASPCVKPDTRTTGKSGPAHARANLSARQAKERGLLTSGTFGPRSSISSASGNLQSFLVNRLRIAVASLGSTLYKLTWKERDTPSGRSIPALRASVVRTLDKDCILSGWPTPCARDFRSDRSRMTDGELYGSKGRPLARIAYLAEWNTPAASDGNGGKRPHPETTMTGRHPSGRKVNMGLASQAHLGFIGTPPARLTAYGEMLTGSSAKIGSGGQLAPAHSLWLQVGPFAIAWERCAEAVTRSLSRKRKRS